MPKIITLVLILVSLPLCAQTPYLVKDINTTNSNNLKSSSPVEFAAFGGKTFFVATTDAGGTELWSTDGTSGGTSIVADIIPGTGSSSPSGLRAVNGALLFNARDVNHGIELWTSDGTAAGTHLLIDINPGPSSSQPGTKKIYKNGMLFIADDGTHGRELWTTDGSAAGTHIVKDINPGSASSSPSYLTVLNDSIYFFATGGLWKTDGTEAGTVKVSSVSGRNLTVAGSQLFFDGFSAASGLEPWVSDGTDAGTHMIADILPGANGSLDNDYSFLGFTALGNKVLFPAGDGVHGRELWISDGTAAGTRLLRDMTPGVNKGTWDDSYAYLTTLGDRTFFRGYDSAHGYALWVTDGTDVGTMLFPDPNAGPIGAPFDLMVSGDKLYFASGSTFLSGSQLWVTDGSTAGTHSLGVASGLGFGINSSVVLWPVNGKMYFNGFTPLSGGEPWVTDGSEVGTRMIANLAPDGAPSSAPLFLTAAGNLLFFQATEGILSPTTNIAEASLWRTDGTAAGTFKLMETGQHPAPPTALGPLVYFGVLDTTSTQWTSDGTLAGTRPAADFLARFGQSRLDRFFPFGDTIFAAAFGLGVSDSSLWKTTATPSGAAVQLGAPNPYGLTAVAGNYFFYSHASSFPYNYGLWTTDGTPAGTYAVVPDLQTNALSLSPLANVAGTLFSLKGVPGENVKLWKSDGTFDGTVVVKELPPGSSVQASTQIKAAGRRVFFLLGSSLWTSDGTESGTLALTNVKFNTTFVQDDLRVAGDRLLFAQYDSTKGYDLWASDGTPQGTKLIMPLGQTNPLLTSIDGTVYFTGFDDQHGAEMWTTDGSAEGTKLLFDINPGPLSSYAQSFTKAGDLLYFAAYTEANGYELWALPLTDPSLSISDARMSEGDTATTVMRFNVTLERTSKQTITVDYATSDGTARAGDDYDSTSGTLTFAPGERAKTIDVRVRGDVSPEDNETFFVNLRNAVGTRVIKGEATGIIEDDEQKVDLSVVPQFTQISSSLNDAVKLSNAGPRSATDVVVSITTTPSYRTQRCTSCPVAQVPVGTSLIAAGNQDSPPQQLYLNATVTARQTDLQPANNSTTWTVNAGQSMAMSPSYLVVGSTATVSANIYTPNPVVTSSDSSVVSAPATVTKVSSGFGTFTITALKPGVSTINVDGRQYPLLITVVAAGTSPRWPGGVTIGTDSTSFTRFDQAVAFTLTPDGIAPVSGTTATGTVIFSANGKELARKTISGSSLIPFPVYMPALGSFPYVISYSGDATFLPQSVTGIVFVAPGLATMTGGVERIAGTAGSFTLTVRATGSPVAAPTGTLSVRNGATEIANVTLVPSSDGTSSARATLSNLPASPTLTINYLGDGLYASSSQQVRLVETRRRSAGH
jgi:ELWxxDGT repeat protein